MDEFANRLRQRLADTAADATMRPDLADVRSRARRQRATAGALGGGASLAVVALALAVATMLPISPDGGVELDPSRPDIADEPGDDGAPADPPGDDDADEGSGHADGEQEPADEPAAPAQACGSLQRLALVVATSDGDLVGMCVDGQTAALAHEGEARSPAVAADGSAIVYEEARDGVSVLRRIDSRSGELTELGDGRMPAFSPDGLLAWVQGEEASPSVMVGEPGGEPAAEHFMGTMVIKDLAWDPGGEALHLVDNAPEGGGLSTLAAMDTEQPAAPAEPPDIDDGGRILAVATSAETGAIGVIRRLGLDQGLSLATTDEVPTGGPLSDLAEVTDLAELDLEVGDLARAQDQADLWLADGGDLRLTEEALTDSGADGPSRLLGDGETVWLVTDDGASAVIAEGAQRAAVNPVADVD